MFTPSPAPAADTLGCALQVALAPSLSVGTAPKGQLPRKLSGKGTAATHEHSGEKAGQPSHGELPSASPKDTISGTGTEGAVC